MNGMRGFEGARGVMRIIRGKDLGVQSMCTLRSVIQRCANLRLSEEFYSLRGVWVRDRRVTAALRAAPRTACQDFGRILAPDLSAKAESLARASG